MSNKKAHPGTGIPGQAAEMTACGASIPVSQYNTDTGHGQPSIADYLGHDRGSARKGRDLCAMLHTDSRTLRQRIEVERRNGAAIVADNRSGYWLTDDPAEAQAFVRSMRRRAHEILKTAQAVEKSMGLD